MSEGRKNIVAAECDFCEEGASQATGPVLKNPGEHKANLHAACAKELEAGALL